jgi:glycosyltransferase involved in cell wall biosynthesis
MRILVLHSRYLSGAVSGENRVVDDEVRLLREAGHDVETWAPSPRSGGASLIRAGVSAIWSPNAISEIRRRIGTARPDVIHVHNLFPELSPAVLRSSPSDGVAVVMTLHNYRSMCLPATFVRDGHPCEDCLGRDAWPGVLHACYRGSRMGSAALAASLAIHRRIGSFDNPRLFLAVSEFVKRKHVEAGWRSEQIIVKTNFCWPATQREGSGEYFLYIGRLSQEKGIAQLLDAWKQVSAPLLIVGDGPQAEELRAMAPDSVEFRGAVAPSDVAEFVRRARAVLVPSICYEGQPRGILEAYAAGVPVIASDIGGLPEIVVDGVSGSLVAPDSADAWRRAIDRLLDDAESERFGDAALRTWSERFTPERGLMGLESAYADAIARTS